MKEWLTFCWQFTRLFFITIWYFFWPGMVELLEGDIVLMKISDATILSSFGVAGFEN